MTDYTAGRLTAPASQLCLPAHSPRAYYRECFNLNPLQIVKSTTIGDRRRHYENFTSWHHFLQERKEANEYVEWS